MTRKHDAEIRAWLDGAELEFKNGNNEWDIIGTGYINPISHSFYEWRIVPMRGVVIRKEDAHEALYPRWVQQNFSNVYNQIELQKKIKSQELWWMFIQELEEQYSQWLYRQFGGLYSRHEVVMMRNCRESYLDFLEECINR